MRHTTHIKKTLEPNEPFSDDAKVVWIWDRNTVDDWNNILNGLLALAGVLIAILTISLNALSQITQKHYAQTTLSLMKEIVAQMNRTHLSGESVTFDVPRSVSTLPREPFSEVESEWWSSLTISLSAAMGTVVLKLWLSAYISSTVSGSMIHKRNLAERSCLKLLRWCKVTPIINILAISLYCAFEHFLTGLLMLFGVSSMIASIISSLVYLSIFPNLVYSNNRFLTFLSQL